LAADSNEAARSTAGVQHRRGGGGGGSAVATPPAPPAPATQPATTTTATPPDYNNTTTTTDLAFIQAAQRLEALLRGAQDGEDELLAAALEASAEGDGGAAERLRLSAALGCLVTAAAVAICWLCGKDPAGGASLSASSLRAAAVGALLSAPVAGLRHWAWSSPTAARLLPVLPDLRLRLAQASGPWVRGLAPAQLAALAAAETIPVTFLLLPAAQGAFSASWAWAASAWAGAAGVGAASASAASAASSAWPSSAAAAASSLAALGGGAAAVVSSSSSSAAAAAPAAVSAATAVAASGAEDGSGTTTAAAALAALAATAAVAAAARYADLCPTQAEYDAVGAAVASCDRFYRLTAAGADESSLSSSSSETQQRSSSPAPEQAALAFKATALSWASVREDAAAAGAIMQATDVALLGAAWHLTGDLTSAAVCALIVAGVDYHHVQRLSSG
jgi:hypothetical protein